MGGGYKAHRYYYRWHLRYYTRVSDATTFCIVCNRETEQFHVVAIYKNLEPVRSNEFFDLEDAFKDECRNNPNGLRELDLDGKSSQSETRVLDNIRWYDSWKRARLVAVNAQIRPVAIHRPTRPRRTQATGTKCISYVFCTVTKKHTSWTFMMVNNSWEGQKRLEQNCLGFLNCM